MLPEIASAAEECTAKVKDVHGEVQRWTGPIDLPEPDEDILKLVHALVWPPPEQY